MASCAAHLRWTMTVGRKGVCDVIAGCGILGMLGMLDWENGGDAFLKRDRVAEWSVKDGCWVKCSEGS